MPSAASLAHAICLALTPALLAGGPLLEFRPEPGSRCTKRLTLVESLELVDFRVEMNGAEVPEQFLPRMEIDLEDRRELHVLDHYVEVADGRPRVLVRSYQGIEREGRFAQRVTSPGAPEEESASDLDGMSALEGASVRFTWDPEQEVYRTAWEEASREGTPPAGLVEDLDLRALLPRGEVTPGDAWTVPAEALAPLLDLCGDLELELDTDDPEQWESEYERESHGGELELRLDALRGEGSARVARVELAGRVTWTGERPGDLSQVPVADGEATQVDEMVYELEGELLWNLALGRVEALDLRGAIELESITTKDGGQPSYSHAVVFEGELTLTLATSAD